MEQINELNDKLYETAKVINLNDNDDLDEGIQNMITMCMDFLEKNVPEDANAIVIKEQIKKLSDCWRDVNEKLKSENIILFKKGEKNFILINKILIKYWEKLVK